MVIWLRGSRGRTPLVKLSNSDSRFLVEMLELRRASILRQLEQSPKARAVELQRLDAILMQIKAELHRPLIRKSLKPLSLCVACNLWRVPYFYSWFLTENVCWL